MDTKHPNLQLPKWPIPGRVFLFRARCAGGISGGYVGEMWVYAGKCGDLRGEVRGIFWEYMASGAGNSVLQEFGPKRC